VISVVIPVFNRREVVNRAVGSVVEQEGVDHEIIVVDDGSTDGSSEVVRQEFGDAVRILSLAENGGVSAARNYGIDQAQGEWIALLDSDDEWKPQKLVRQIRELESTGLQICHTDEIWIRNGVRVNPHKHHQKRGGALFLKSLDLCSMSPSSLVVRKEIVIQAGRFDETLPVCEDYDLFLRLTCRYGVAYLAAKLVVKYGGHGDQLSRQYSAMDRFRVRAISKLLEAGELDDTQQRAAVNTLLLKARIVFDGATKRKNQQLATSMQRYIDRWGE
jgi:glycosyltransferase involved in cell wall biosynthesis